MHELTSSINKLPSNKAPGDDLIFAPMLKNLGVVAKEQLLNIINASWHTGKLPKTWKTTIILPIFKPFKDAKNCSSYRLIALISILCKLTERLIHSRLMLWLTESRKINFYQTAYRSHYSTTDQLFYLCQSIIDSFQDKPPKKTIAVFLDLSSVFDSVWRQKLIKIVHDTGINGSALIWIADFF